MKLCFDTNVVIDILAQTEDYSDSFSAYDVAALRKDTACIPMFTTSDIAYILHRFLHDAKREREALKGLLVLFEVLDGHLLDCQAALVSPMIDYEDALLACCAQRSEVDIIITRNKKGFAHSPITALTPKEYLQHYKPEGIEYKLVDADASDPE